jgi:hypothetical protein
MRREEEEEEKGSVRAIPKDIFPTFDEYLEDEERNCRERPNEMSVFVISREYLRTLKRQMQAGNDPVLDGNATLSERQILTAR